MQWVFLYFLLQLVGVTARACGARLGQVVWCVLAAEGRQDAPHYLT
ncbi:hypothetical protein [Ktedonobacter racemifer]|nr:hypothetical protein [Ktedonobacter racemifer]